MLDFEKTTIKRKTAYNLYVGEIILYNSELYMFDRIPNGNNSIYVRDVKTLKHFSIVIKDYMMFDVVGWYDFEKLYKTNNDNISLQKGDLFVVQDDKKGSFIFRFDRYTPFNIIGTNVLDNKETRITKSKRCTKIENIPF